MVPERKGIREVALVCNACGREFAGTATYTIMRLGEESGMERPVLDRIESRCPRCGSRDVRERDA